MAQERRASAVYLSRVRSHAFIAELAHALRETRADLPVVMATGYITEELRAKVPAAGIRELIYKPNTVDELCEAVARLAQTVGEKSKSF